MTTPNGFTEGQQRHLLCTFRYVDQLLAEVEQVLAVADSPSPFQHYVADSAPIQRKVAHDYITRIRQAMCRMLAEQGIEMEPPSISALWAARTHLLGASVAADELAPKYLRGYGPLTEEKTKAVEAIVAELRIALDKLQGYLAQDASADLQTRLVQLQQTTAEVALMRELERIITAHGLVEFRPALARLLDRLEDTVFEIGVFGRVNSGKSSLLNHLLQTEVLPVGVTPVTAVPTRIRYGSQPEARIEFAEGQPQLVELSRLAEFATEQHNPGNARNVARIEVRVPAARLSEGVAFVDTPGLGSLAVAGADETRAYLPRCDLGVLLIDAGSTLTDEDVVVVQALYHAGASAMVLVSKADLQSEAERQQTADYVRQKLRAEANISLPVRPVSVRGAKAALCDRWFDEELRPLLDKHQEQARASQKRKAGLLRESVLVVLEKRLQTASRPPPRREVDRLQAADRALREARQLLETNACRASDLARDTDALADAVLEAAAAELADSWRAQAASHPGAASIASASLTRLVAAWAAQILALIEQTRARLDETLCQAGAVASPTREPPEPLPASAGMPVEDWSVVTRKIAWAPPGWLGRFHRGWLQRRVQQQLAAQMGGELRARLRLYGRRVTVWAKQTFDTLEAAFTARADVYRAQWALEQPAVAPGAGNAPAMAADLRLLQNWPANGPAEKESATNPGLAYAASHHAKT